MTDTGGAAGEIAIGDPEAAARHRCARCGTDHLPAQRFCGHCGAALTAGCPQCGENNPPGQRFCGNCGSPLPTIDRPDGIVPSAAAPAPVVGTPVPVTERRMCSVLFADLVGFTPLSETRDPEEVRELLSQYFDTARTVIGRYGGTVEKFIGDAVMAVWGTPVAGEGDAERAVRAGLDLAGAVTTLGEQAGVPGLAARVGIVTGEVAANLGAIGQGMVAGDAVNTAARVQAAAAAGRVWVDEATHRLAVTAIGFDDVGNHDLKGKSEPAHLWAATRVLAGVGGAQRVDGLEGPMIGREANLRLLKDLLHGVTERRTPALVLISGPAGVGKSRLGWEFEKYVDGLADEVWWHRGRCLSYGDGVVFWALAEIVRQRLGIAEEDAPAVAAGKLSEGLRRHVADPAQREYIAVRLGRLLGIPVAADTGNALAREELFAGWRLFFEHLASTQPVLLLVEDAQRADTGLLDFLDHLVDWSRNLPILVLVFARPELTQQHPGWGTGRGRSSLSLDPLDLPSMVELAKSLVPDLPASAAAAIAERAQGIPLFAVETIRSLIDRDIVVPRDGVYRLVGDIGELAVPDGLRPLLAARLDGLGPDLRALVADAAVLGSTFPAEALEAVSGRPIGQVREALAELVRREIFEVSADKLSPQRGSFGFTQDLLRQVAYETLSRRDRKARHLAVAAHLRSAFARDGDEVIDVIAHHYQDALTAVPGDPDVDAIRDQAVDALIRAAQRAGRAGAPGGAAASYSAAAQLRAAAASPCAATGDPGDAAGNHGAPVMRERASAGALWEAAAEAAVLAGDAEQAIAHAEAARDWYAARNERRGAARADALAGRALRAIYRLTDAKERLTADLVVLQEDPDEATAVALAELGMVQVMAYDREAAVATAEALRIGQLVGAGDTTMCTLLTDHALAVDLQDRSVEAIALLEHAIRLAERDGDSAGRGRALLNLCYVVSQWDPKAAMDAARASVEYCRRVGAGSTLPIAIGNFVDSLIWIGDWDGAATAIADARLPVNPDDGLPEQADAAVPVVLLAALRGDPTAAQQLAALDTRIEPDDGTSKAQSAAIAALIAEADGRLVDALAACRRALRLGKSRGVKADFVGWSWPVAARAAWKSHDASASDEMLSLLDGLPVGRIPSQLRAERDIARARLAAGDQPDRSAELFREGVRGLRAFGSPYHLAHALIDHAAFLSSTGHHTKAAAAIAEARQITDVLRARPLAERVRVVADASGIPVEPATGLAARSVTGAVADFAAGPVTHSTTGGVATGPHRAPTHP